MDRIHKGRFHATLHLSPGVLLKLNHSAAGARTHTPNRPMRTLLFAQAWWSRSSAPVPTAGQTWDKVHSPEPGRHTVESICGKHYICSLDYTRPGLLLQMVVASRNVTFDLASHMEQEFYAGQWKSSKVCIRFRGRKKDKREKNVRLFVWHLSL